MQRTILLLLITACGPVIVDPPLTTGGSDDMSDGEPTSDPCDLPAAGTVWGPCRPDHTCDGEEDGKFGCMFVPDADAPQGSLCAPLCDFSENSLGACPLAENASWCGEALGTPTCEVTTACGLACETDKDCGPMLACFGARCLWPEG